jgi:hypothetical protein
MDKKKGIIFLLIIAIFMLSVMNLVAASANKPMTAAYCVYKRDTTAPLPTTLIFNVPTQAKVNVWFDVNRSLTAAG